jgi:hypothetical protein
MIFHDLLARLDASSFLGIRVWDFSFRSLTRWYGLTFLSRIVVRYPLRALQGLLRYRRLPSPLAEQCGMAMVGGGSQEELESHLAEDKARLLVAVGFCQKPLVPACPAGRPNHDCAYLDEMDLETPVQVEDAACRECDIRTIGTLALGAGASMHIMTSALDIAHDVMIPSIDGGRFRSLIMCLCPYSVQAITLPLMVCGLEGYLVGYVSGNCADYDQWLQADRGIKNERTALAPEDQTRVYSLLERIAGARAREGERYARFRRRGNIYEPVLLPGPGLRVGPKLI